MSQPAHQTPKYVPTPEEIEAAKEEIRREWKSNRAPKPMSDGSYGKTFKMHQKLGKDLNLF